MAAFSGSYIWGNVRGRDRLDVRSPLIDMQGTSYVSWPRLNPPIEILSYNGPGVRSLSRGRGMSIAGMIPMKVQKGLGNAMGRKTEEVELGKLGKRKGALID